MQKQGKCDNCGSEEFTPRIQDAVDDVLLVCDKCGQVHVVKS